MPGTYEFRINKNLNVKYWNSGMEELSHIKEDEAVGKKINKIFPLLYEKIVPVFKDGRKRNIKNFKNICFMGTDLAADIKLIPVKNKKGQIEAADIILSNINGRCPLIKKLSDAEKMVEIGKVASSLAHGVRNPLNAIKGAVVHLKEKYEHETTLLEFSTIINDEINKLDNFISTFLSTAKGQAKITLVQINDIIMSIVSMVRPRTELQNVGILTDLSDVPFISADSFQLEQAVFNIINNALEAMPDGGEMGIRTSLKWEGGSDYVLIEISDTGQGIPDGKLHELGELSAGSGRDDRGFGIFLSREIVKSHNGKLLWESMRDRGTIFKIMLPASYD
jgi:two-component system nitrogen regulation sensor histidine kinase GlnL